MTRAAPGESEVDRPTPEIRGAGPAFGDLARNDMTLCADMALHAPAGGWRRGAGWSTIHKTSLSVAGDAAAPSPKLADSERCASAAPEFRACEQLDSCPVEPAN